MVTSQQADNGIGLDDDDIAQRAYEIYEQEGRPIGRALDHWQEAKEQLRAAQSKAETEPAASDDAEPGGQSKKKARSRLGGD